MKCILGRKKNMAQLFAEDGKVTPVTWVHAGPCTVTGVREEQKDGYYALALGFELSRHLRKPQREILKDLKPFRVIREFRMQSAPEMKRGDLMEVSQFEVGDFVDVVGISKGRGFQGVVKRHGFHGSPASHGHKDQLRIPGSIGATGVQRVFKGVRMAGRMGGDRVTVKNMEVVAVDTEKGRIALKGAVPGAFSGLIMIRSAEGGRGKWRK